MAADKPAGEAAGRAGADRPGAAAAGSEWQEGLETRGHLTWGLRFCPSSPPPLSLGHRSSSFLLERDMNSRLTAFALLSRITLA